MSRPRWSRGYSPGRPGDWGNPIDPQTRVIRVNGSGGPVQRSLARPNPGQYFVQVTEGRRPEEPCSRGLRARPAGMVSIPQALKLERYGAILQDRVAVVETRKVSLDLPSRSDALHCRSKLIYVYFYIL